MSLINTSGESDKKRHKLQKSIFVKREYYPVVMKEIIIPLLNLSGFLIDNASDADEDRVKDLLKSQESAKCKLIEIIQDRFNMVLSTKQLIISKVDVVVESGNFIVSLSYRHETEKTIESTYIQVMFESFNPAIVAYKRKLLLPSKDN